MESFSQHKEDLFIYKYINENGIDVPNKIIDIGALTGLHNSNSRFFINKGWDCIMIEPNPNSFNTLKENTKNLKCILENVAICETDENISFEIGRIPGHSKINKENGKITVKGMTLNSLFEKYPDYKELGILDIDVEGYEEIILTELLKTEIRPTIIIVEHQKIGDRIKKQNDILSNEYEMIKSISVNNIWLKK